MLNSIQTILYVSIIFIGDGDDFASKLSVTNYTNTVNSDNDDTDGNNANSTHNKAKW